MSSEPGGRTFHFVGESLCIDFVNTEVVEAGLRIDLFDSFDDVVQWCVAARLISASEERELRRRSGGIPDAESAFQLALRFRASLREMLEQLALGRRKVPQRALDAINDVLAMGSGVREIVSTKSGYAMRMRRSIAAANQLLVPIAESAADLLADGDLALVKKCQNPQCILFFYDTTKNHARRWCSMAACGNRAKVAAHYHRVREHASR
jgi:predicted RNA-binding Zn ribbon-like protein